MVDESLSAEEARRKGVNFIGAEQLGKELLAGKQRALARLNRAVGQLRSTEWEAAVQHDGKTFSVQGRYIVTQMPKRPDDKKRIESGMAIVARMVRELKGAGFNVTASQGEDHFGFSAVHQAQNDATPLAAVRDPLDAEAAPMSEKAAVDLGAKRLAPGIAKDAAMKEQMEAEKAANQKPPDGTLAPGEAPVQPLPGDENGPPPANELPETAPGEPSPNSQ